MKYVKVGDPETRSYLWDELYFKVYKDELEVNSEIIMSADVDFDFRDNNKNVQHLRAIIGDDIRLNSELDELAKCYHNVCNFSIIPATGGMNDKKGKCDFDRFDRYIYMLKLLLDAIQEEGAEQFYKSFKSTVIEFVTNDIRFFNMDKKYYLINGFAGPSYKGLSKLDSYRRKLESLKNLTDYLSNYSFEKYCEKFYKLNSDSKLLKEILESGEKERFDKKYYVEKYFKIARDYWNCKKEQYIILGVSEDKIAELNSRVAKEYL